MVYWSAKKTNIYHTCKNCTVGKNIESHNLRIGTPYFLSAKCSDCKELEQQNKSNLDIPTFAR